MAVSKTQAEQKPHPVHFPALIDQAKDGPENPAHDSELIQRRVEILFVVRLSPRRMLRNAPTTPRSTSRLIAAMSRRKSADTEVPISPPTR